MLRGFSWQITPRALLEATTDPDRAAAKRAMEAMFTMRKIDIATIEAARRGEGWWVRSRCRAARRTGATTLAFASVWARSGSGGFRGAAGRLWEARTASKAVFGSGGG